MTFATRGFELTGWQRSAVEAWTAGDGGHRNFGTIEVVTGGGKSLIALECAAEVARSTPGLKLAIVVPTQALARQWRDVLLERTTLKREEVSILGGGAKGDLAECRALVAVLNSAAKKLPTMARSNQPLMLIVDECHRAGAPKFSRVLQTTAEFRLGLSATPDREDVDDDGEPLRYDEQAVGQSLGDVVFAFGLKEAREHGWLPEYTLHHHAVSLLPEQRLRYDALSRQVDDAGDEMRSLGGEPARGRQLARRGDDLGSAAKRWVASTGKRKDMLYRASERHRVATLLTQALFDGVRPDARVILFHERVREAEELHAELSATLPGVRVVIEHSKLPAKVRTAALADFSSGKAPVLVSVKSLIEGIDVPAADTGISVASTASVRQRVQALGRVLRRSVDVEGNAKRAEMHLLYVDDTVDDLIYAKTDWSDLTGQASNRYWRWPANRDPATQLDGPPRRPKPTEDEAWSVVVVSDFPAPWPGEVTGQEYTVGTNGVVHNAFGRLIENAQGVSDMISSLRGRPGGRFHVTPQHRAVVVWEASEGEVAPWVVGRLTEPFRVTPEVTEGESVDVANLRPGAPYPGPSDRKGGVFRISQRGGGQVERTVRGGRELAAVADTPRGRNAQTVLDAWDAIGRGTSKFFVNSLGHAWFEADGQRVFLANVTGGFAWPSEAEEVIS